jgi:hypothetical protein
MGRKISKKVVYIPSIIVELDDHLQYTEIEVRHQLFSTSV